jgi:hypothetical protein
MSLWLLSPTGGDVSVPAMPLVPTERRPATGGIVLAVDVRRAGQLVAEHRPGAALVMTRFALLDRALLDRVKPDCVLVPLIGPGFDAVQALTLLRQLNYRLDVCVTTSRLPAPDMVLSELNRHAGRKDVHLVEV